MSTSTRVECDRSTNGQHQTYGGHVCALCGTEPQAGPALVIDPQAFRQGEALAYSRVLAVIEGLQDGQEATKGRDEGRGVAHAANSLRQAVVALIEDAGLVGEVLHADG